MISCVGAAEVGILAIGGGGGDHCLGCCCELNTQNIKINNRFHKKAQVEPHRHVVRAALALGRLGSEGSCQHKQIIIQPS